MLAGFAEAQVFLARNKAADIGVPAERRVTAIELTFTGSPFPRGGGRRGGDAVRDGRPPGGHAHGAVPRTRCGMTRRAVCPRLTLPAVQAAGLVAELLSAACEVKLGTKEVERLREVQEGLRKTASLLGGFIRGYKKAVTSQ
ncbi:hypothetical protein [Streptomyces albicerus]|uniref:hypothetical protein n=1 Tax=Streptomyces albicerus TaxID=2569859 RepID=UPI00124AF656|nr:hypothetical protein [Streptomyces albicerus]